MARPRICPGQDTRYWTPEHLFDAACAHCGAPIEFFKDDLRRTCPHCGEHSVNPRNDMACAAWCPSAAECLAQMGLSEAEIAARLAAARAPKQ